MSAARLEFSPRVSGRSEPLVQKRKPGARLHLVEDMASNLRDFVELAPPRGMNIGPA